ncbi:TonB-dependent receptor domain-containing protein [Novosphingobium capsulatum]|uniref:TonB-dependent receptor domain-containing protein n=1 Tax=Novosphingobium capsulatum TaxID=13688 RepID=UPI000A8E7DDE|nr:TonB-dependent receptor [Novosphingobium capsulatum]WQD94957.1 TonB-dependent receptor [Novosphingobium capsulatum]
MRLEGTRLVLSASALSVAVALATPALAQAAPQANAAPDTAPAAEAAQPDVKEIVVTGSLIQRPNNTAVSPIVSVSNEAIKASGNVNLQDALNQFPGFTPAGNSGTGGQGTGGRASVNLHGLGPNRNLVLLDGKRLPLSDISGTVDTNIIPESIIGGVDVITGGASAVYGSDAMSGVVNFKTLRSFDGVKADVQNSLSEKGDAYKFSGSIAFGSSFAQDRGHVIAAFSYTDQDPINGKARSFFSDKTPSSYIGTGTFVPNATNAPNAAVVQSVFAGYGVTSTINPLLNLGFNNDGSLFVQTGAVNYKGLTNSGGYALVGGNVRMPVGQQVDFMNGLKRKTAFIKADYDLTPNLTLYGQFLFVDLNVHTASGNTLTQFGQLTTIPVTNPFIPQDLRTVLASRPNPTANFLWNGRYVGLPYKSWDEDYTVQQYMAGLKGNIAPGWTFDVYASYDQSVHNQTMHNAVVKSRVQNLLSAADGGNSLCQGGFNPFGDANMRSVSAACAAYMTKDAFSAERLGQTQFQGQINGKLFDLGAGPAQIALVAGYRKNTYNYRPDSDLQAQNLEAVTASQPASGRISVKELAGQIDIPLVADKPFIRELGIGAAARVSNYSVSGTVTSYEADMRWRPTDTIMLRGGYQRAVRAPNIGELFSPQQGTQLVIGTPPGSLGDPCDYRSTARTGANGAQVAALCVAQGVPQAAIGSYSFPTTATGQLVSGNIGLRPEHADTFNAGVVFNAPRGGGLFGDFSFSVDYYNISIKNVISTVPGLTVLSKCYNLDGSNPGYAASNPYCALIQRDSNGQLVNVATPYLNLGSLKTDGVEAQVNWATPAPFLGRTGKIYTTTTVGWLHAYKVQLLPGAAEMNYTNISNGAANPSSVPPRATPRWKALTTLGYRSDNMGIGLRWRFQSAMQDVSSVLTPNNTQVGIAAYNLYDLFGNVKVGKMFELRAGINNLLNAKLPYVASSQNGTDVALYDPIGRSFYIGARVSF